MFISRNIYNAYVRALKLEGSGIAYYQNYEQVFLEGSNNLCELVPMSNKKDSIYIHLTTQKNKHIRVFRLFNRDRFLVRFSLVNPDKHIFLSFLDFLPLFTVRVPHNQYYVVFLFSEIIGVQIAIYG